MPTWERAQDQIAGDEALNEYVRSMRNPVTIGPRVRCLSLERIVTIAVSQMQAGTHTDIVLLDLEAEGAFLLSARVWPTSALRFIALDEVFGHFDGQIPASPVTLAQEREYGRFLIAYKLRRNRDRRPHFPLSGTSLNFYDNVPTLAREEVRDRVRDLLSWTGVPGLAAPCKARNASASARNGMMHYLGSDVAQYALAAGRASLLAGGAPIDVLTAVNRSGAIRSDPTQPNRGYQQWVGTPCHTNILEALLGTSNIPRIVTGHSALCNPVLELGPGRPGPTRDPRHSGLTGHPRPAPSEFEGAALLSAIDRGRVAVEDFRQLHEIHRIVMAAGCEIMGPS